MLRSSDAKRLARTDDEAKAVTQATEDAVKARLAAAAGLGDYHAQVASQVESDLEELMGALRPAGGQ